MIFLFSLKYLKICLTGHPIFGQTHSYFRTSLKSTISLLVKSQCLLVKSQFFCLVSKMHHFLDERPICCRWCCFLSERLQTKKWMAVGLTHVDTRFLQKLIVIYGHVHENIMMHGWILGCCDFRDLCRRIGSYLGLSILLSIQGSRQRPHDGGLISLGKPVRQRTYRQLQRCHLAACWTRLLPRAARWQ